jgi:hypothetical protein
MIISNRHRYVFAQLARTGWRAAPRKVRKEYAGDCRPDNRAAPQRRGDR